MFRKLVYTVFLPVILIATLFLGYLSLSTTFNFEIWGMRSILDSTYTVAREKAQRIEQKIIDSDNAVMSIVDMSNLEDLKERWQHFSGVSHAVDSIFVIDSNRSVIFSVSDYTGSDFQKIHSLFQDVVAPQLELVDGKTRSLRHFHFKYDGKYYLFSYQSRQFDNVWYTVCLNYNIDLIKEVFLPELFKDLANTKLYNVIDTEGNLVFGSVIKESGEFIVGWKIPSTLYEWRIQVAPTQASFYEATSRKKHIYDSIVVAIAFGVLFLGIILLILMIEQERRLGFIKEDFIANISHELKTPLSIIHLYSEMLLGGKIADREKEKKYLQVIAREGDRLASLIDTVLDFARLERGKIFYEKINCDLVSTVKSAVDMSVSKFEQTGIRLETSLCQQPVEVMHDPHSITLAIVNLLDNAIKYADGTDKVLVSVYKSNGLATISVKDWGPGIPKGEQKHIFDRFYRGYNAKKKHRRGTGIGLALVKSVVENNEGKVKVISPIDEKGRGTEFIITLPTVSV